MHVYIGYDQREKLAYDVAKYSISHNTHNKVKITPLCHKQLRRQGWFSRPWVVNAYDGNYTDLIDGKPFSTEFAHTRFLVPALNRYRGWALFMDCDMVWDDNIKDLFSLFDDKYAVMCVKHIHRPSSTSKMDGVVQSVYPRKNWSSFMAFNCAHPANGVLTPELVSTRSGSWLHNFSWLEDVHIGNLPLEYNWIPGVSPATLKPKVIHYTEGGPWFDGHEEVAHASVWWRYMQRLLDTGEYQPVKETINVDYGVRP